ncbi:adenosine receptor A1-like [Polyodon spathula]|uniref:adenosine receptor A1-like n=1 Tax=Polyodon spathula TaxID=7913 RepID=UPI001B7DA123|nr:adenosine receptor A1-like [Polyodon spathula]
MPANGNAISSLDMAYIVFEAVIALASLSGNVLVVWAVKLNKALRDTTFYLIVSLAVADIAVGAVAIPIAILISLEVNMHFYCCLFASCLLCILTQNSILSLLAIAIDRYLRVKQPVKYRAVMTHRRAWMAVGVCWLVPTILGLLPMLGWHRGGSLGATAERNSSSSSSTEGRYKACSFSAVTSMDYVVYFNFFGLILTPLLLMLGLYVLVFTTIKKQLQHSQAACKASRLQKELKLANALALVLALFAMCWLPLPIMNSVGFFCPTCHVSKPILYCGILLSHANSAINPVVYAFKIKKFRVTFLKIWHHYYTGSEWSKSAPHSNTLQSQGAEKSDSV